MTAAKIAAYNKFGVDFTAAQKALAVPADKTFMVYDTESTPQFPMWRYMTVAEIDAKAKGDAALTTKAAAAKKTLPATTKAYDAKLVAYKKVVTGGKQTVVEFDAAVNKLLALPAHSGAKAPTPTVVAQTT